ncbi:hypothetical protein RI129_006432 [Pyrocoelia pectoralis]|uniref:Uncharacterized protein n=1 Tax=Pyrocoelia pectoralis TaxID=417401 RepID=A0AAN7VCF5_9COLE
MSVEGKRLFKFLILKKKTLMHALFLLQNTSPLEIHLAPTGRELVQALRAVLLQAHWHACTLLADSPSVSALQRGELWSALSVPPLHPTLIALPHRPQSIFRKLADLSRLTRGVIVLFCDRFVAIRILEDAKRLNMMDGHFVWIWFDTAQNESYRNMTEDFNNYKDSERDKRGDKGGDIDYFTHRNDNSENSKMRLKRGVQFESDLSDSHLNLLLQNDQFLLFNNHEGVESSKFKKRVDANSNVNVKTRKKLNIGEKLSDLPSGLLSLRPLPIRLDRHLVKAAVRLLVTTLKVILDRCPDWLLENIASGELQSSCWKPAGIKEFNFSTIFARELKMTCSDALAGKKIIQENGVDKLDKSLVSNFEVLNLVPDRTTKDDDTNKTVSDGIDLKWKRVGIISGRSVRLDTIVWPGGDLSVAAVSSRARSVFRVVTALAPPFVMEGELDEDGQCLRGLPCHRVLTSDKDNLTLVFNEMEMQERLEEESGINSQYKHSGHFTRSENDDDKFSPFQKFKYRTNCCYGLAMDLLENIAHELEFDFRLYIVSDGLYGSRNIIRRHKRDVGKHFLNYRFKQEVHGGEPGSRELADEIDVKWNGVVGDLVSGAAHMSFAALSVSRIRSEVIDYSIPYYFSGVSFLAAPQQKSEIPLLAFLLPFSPELWIAIFTSLNITAIAVAIYEWLSPFGLNPWGRQRSKNFSMSSALWVMWGLLCGHLVAFKAPKSWPNKFLINVWGGFSVIFVASYTANIAALIAGLFFHNTVSNYHDRSLLSQKVGAPRASAAEYYVQRANKVLWDHITKYRLENVEEGIARLRNGTLDILIADTPILDYYRATDHGCKLQQIGDTINEDTYAVGMNKGFPLKDSISAIISKYSSNGYMDILQEKWYGGLPCFKVGMTMDMESLSQPKPLGVAAVTGVFILLGVGMVLGCLILFVEHMFFRYTLPVLRDKPKDSVWRSRNIMFFSQKLYRFINCVELVSPHHAARELVHTIRQGQITSLFQKSVKRKEHEQRRRRRSKAQFFEMIQEIRSTIRRQQQEERTLPLESVTEVESEYQLTPEEKKTTLSPSIIRRTFLRTSPKTENPPKAKSPALSFTKQLFSPRAKNKNKSSTALNVRRFSTDSVFASQTLRPDRSTVVGRRLSKDASCFLSHSPPDINSRRSSYLDIVSTGAKLAGKSPVLSIENVSDCSSKSTELPRKLSDSESIGRKLATLPKYTEPGSRHRLHPQYSLTIGKSDQMLNASDSSTKLGQSPHKLTKSYQNILDTEREVPRTLSQSNVDHKSNLSDDEIAKRNKITIDQLQSQLSTKVENLKPPIKRCHSNNTKPNPPRIQVEDTSKLHSSTSRKLKKRHQSLGDDGKPSQTERSRSRNKLSEHSRSLDSNPQKESSRSRSPRCKEHDLPPAPPPPNCSPRNSNGKSPLDRLSKDELVLLWRSSESELRSHLLKAIRDKGSEDPP